MLLCHVGHCRLKQMYVQYHQTSFHPQSHQYKYVHMMWSVKQAFRTYKICSAKVFFIKSTRCNTSGQENHLYSDIRPMLSDMFCYTDRWWLQLSWDWSEWGNIKPARQTDHRASNLKKKKSMTLQFPLQGDKRTNTLLKTFIPLIPTLTPHSEEKEINKSDLFTSFLE